MREIRPMFKVVVKYDYPLPVKTTR